MIVRAGGHTDRRRVTQTANRSGPTVQRSCRRRSKPAPATSAATLAGAWLVWKTFSGIHNDLKSCPDTELTIPEILAKVTQGYCIKVGAFKLQDYTAAEQSELRELYREDFNAYATREAEIKNAKKLQLVSTDLLIIDIDDRTGATDLKKVFEYSGAAALYYSFSHGKQSVFHTKQNAYRLIYTLDAPITEEPLLKHVQEALKNELYQVFPTLLPVEGVKSGNNGIDVLGTGFFFGTDKKEYLINDSPRPIHAVSYTHLTLPTNREV